MAITLLRRAFTSTPIFHFDPAFPSIAETVDYAIARIFSLLADDGVLEISGDVGGPSTEALAAMSPFAHMKPALVDVLHLFIGQIYRDSLSGVTQTHFATMIPSRSTVDSVSNICLIDCITQ